MTGLIIGRRKPGRHRTHTTPPRQAPGRSLSEYWDARALGMALPTRHPAWLAEVRREWQEQRRVW